MAAITYRSPFRCLLEGLEGLAVLVVVVPTWPISRHALENWGSTASERAQARPGDRLVTAAQETYSRAIGIAAPAEIAWRWVIQFGLGRAGFYSYEIFERLMGIPVRNVESIVPEFQSLAPGDEIRLHPKAPGIPVAAVEAQRYVCFGEDPAAAPSATTPDPRRSWSMYVDEVDEESCRLVVRSCIEGLREPTLLKRLGLAVEVPLDFVMEQRMLRTIKRLAEGEYRRRE